MHIGLDLDNTIISYDRLFHELAVERGLAPENFPQNKTAIRDRIRTNFRDDVWQELQAAAYGPELSRADIFPGVVQVLRRWRAMGFNVFIISHKTSFASKGYVPLRRASLDFLRTRGILSLVSGVFFVNEMWQKAALAFELGCGVMVDDLPEVFAAPSFPQDIRPILFMAPAITCVVPRNFKNLKLREVIGREAHSPTCRVNNLLQPVASSPVTVCASWMEIDRRVREIL